MAKSEPVVDDPRDGDVVRTLAGVITRINGEWVDSRGDTQTDSGVRGDWTDGRLTVVNRARR